MTDVWYHAGGSWLRIAQAWRNVAGTWKQVYAMPTSGGGSGGSGPSLAVVASPSSYSHTVSSTQAGNASISFFASASGGAGGYSFAWTRLAVGTIAATASGQTTATLTLGVSWSVNANREYSETWQVAATDSAGATATFNITFYYDIETPH